MVDGEDVDGATLVAQLPAGTALNQQVSMGFKSSGYVRRASYAWGVPSTDSLGATNVGEPLHIFLGLPAVLGHEAVGAV